LNLFATMERILEERSRQLVLPPAEDPSVCPTPAEVSECQRSRDGTGSTHAITIAATTTIRALSASRGVIQDRPVAGSHQSHSRDGKEDDSSMAQARRVSRAQAAASPTTEGERLR
jgi:hypothetical protein